MRQNFVDFCRSTLSNFFEAVVNLFIFLPYFFSVKALLKTLFVPWKNLVAKKTVVGFSFDEWLTRCFFNLISRIIGFFMRISVIFFYLIIQILFLIVLPFILVSVICCIPFVYLESLLTKTEDEKKKILHDQFLSTHLLKEENRQIVEQWFEAYYQKHLRKQDWWKLSNLLSTPPLARDWADGFTPILDQYSDDLTRPDYQMHREHIVDRQKEIAQIEQVLVQSEEANVIIVGDEGVGKHTIVDALAKKMYEGKTNTIIMYKRILKLNMEKILNQYIDQKQRENFFEDLLKEAIYAKNIIILIDGFERYIVSEPDKINLTNPIQKSVKYSSVQIVGITDPFAYQKYVLPNTTINRLFTKVDVYEISSRRAEAILLDIAYLYEYKHKVTVPYETLHAIIEKSSFFITDIPFPEKAIHLLDRMCVYATTQSQRIAHPDFVDIVLSETTHVPTVVTSQIKEKLLGLETKLYARIIQQKEAVQKLSSVLKSSFILIDKRKKPLATFLFLGPTGVGKTQTAKTIASLFFGSEKYLVRFDMSLYQQKRDISQLVGSTDTENPGLLTVAIRETPYGVLLLDEIEKAHKDLLHIFLTILDEGYFTEGGGKKVDCKNLIIIATSNAGSSELFASQLTDSKLIEYLVQHKLFTPEFINRFDGVVTYKPLSQEAIIQIAQMKVDEIAHNISKLHKITLKVSKEYLIELTKKGYNPKFGARNMERLIRDEIEGCIANMILENRLKEGDIIRL